MCKSILKIGNKILTKVNKKVKNMLYNIKPRTRVRYRKVKRRLTNLLRRMIVEHSRLHRIIITLFADDDVI